MAFKQFTLQNGTLITVYKRRTSRSLRLSLTPAGQIRVSIPTWAPYGAGLQFAASKQQWIDEQKQPLGQLVAGQSIGKAHHLRFVTTTADTISSRVRTTEVVISHPVALAISSPHVQTAAEAASIRALRQQAEALLPQRLARLATTHGFRYHDVTVKRMKSRWGSCDAHGHIVLNLYLMQLPWDCIDYVLLHELAHTRVLRHGTDFWQLMKTLVPDMPEKRKRLRTYQPILHRPLSSAVT
jgi:predicted metal-dependent hydrolase